MLAELLTEKNCLKKYGIKPVILSRGRSETITTTDLLPKYVDVIVPESEKEEYSNKIQNNIITVQDEIEGLGNLRNWVLDKFSENCIIMFDDDLTSMYCLTGTKTRSIKDPEEIMQTVINTAVMAMDMGVHCFGFAQTDIRKYKGTEPFNLATWVGGVIGVIGRKYKFRSDYFKVDIDYCLQNLLADRIIFQNTMYTFPQKRDFNTGGNSKFRTEKKVKESVDSLKEKWQDYIDIKEFKNQFKIRIKVSRKQKGIQYE